MTRVSIPISVGELWDKYTILLIKSKKITCPDKLLLINHEIQELQPFINQYSLNKEIIDELYNINTTLWELEDKIREKDNENDFGNEFISISKSIYVMNDKRYETKREINTIHNSNIMEVKSYKKYNSNI